MSRLCRKSFACFEITGAPSTAVVKGEMMLPKNKEYDGVFFSSYSHVDEFEGKKLVGE